MRGPSYRRGLIDMIEYIKKFIDPSRISMIEIGSYAGESTKIFAGEFKKVIAIDPYLNDYDENDVTCDYMELTKVYDVFMQNISDHDNIVHIRKTSDAAILDLNESGIEFVYIDGLHTYDQVKKDISNYLPIISNGFIAGHDYHPKWRGIIDGVNESIGKPDATFQDTSWIKRVKNL
jgi:hypothetical protein